MADLTYRVPHTIPGNPMVFERPIKIVKDERWKNEFTRHDLEVFDKIAGRLNREMGYVN